MTTEQNKLADRIIEERVGWRDDGGRLGVFFNGSDMDLIVAALRAAGEPVAYKCQRCGYNRNQHAGADVAHCGEFVDAAQPAPSASVREIERELADCQGALDIIASKRIPDNKTQWGNERYYQGRKQSLEFVLGLISSTPSPLMAAGEAGGQDLRERLANPLHGTELRVEALARIEALEAQLAEVRKALAAIVALPASNRRSNMAFVQFERAKNIAAAALPKDSSTGSGS